MKPGDLSKNPSPQAIDGVPVIRQLLQHTLSEVGFWHGLRSPLHLFVVRPARATLRSTRCRAGTTWERQSKCAVERGGTIVLECGCLHRRCCRQAQPARWMSCCTGTYRKERNAHRYLIKNHLRTDRRRKRTAAHCCPDRPQITIFGSAEGCHVPASRGRGRRRRAGAE